MKFIFILLAFSFISKDMNSDAFYKIFSTSNILEIDETINSLKQNSKTSKNRAYLGALLMKKSNFEKDIKLKIKLFKEGANILEKEILANKTNVEYRFIRLIIQENAPKILKYNKNIEEDKEIIITNFELLNNSLKKHIKKYSADSKALFIDKN